MGRYLSVREAAEKWGVSERRINQYCSEGRIPGAEKIGKAWVIPADADKPGDPRKRKNQSVSHKPPNAPELFPGFMPLLNTRFEPGRCMETIEKMKAGPKKDIAMAEYRYFSGQAEKAMQDTEVYLTSTDGAIRLSACWIFAYSCLTAGRIDHARHALQEIQNTLAANRKTAPPVRAIESFAAFAAAVLLHLPLPEEMPPMETFLPLLPPGIRAFALYVLAHYLYLKEEYGQSAGIVEATLAMGADAVAIASAALVAAGCQQYRICNTGACPIGAATQDPELRKRLQEDKAAKRLANYLNACKAELEMFGRITGHSNIHDLNVTDLKTTNREISEYTNIEHV